MVFSYVWEYEVQSSNQEAFLKLYGPEGEWVEFFKKSAAYIRTELHQDIDNEERFITIDYWKSREACDFHRKENQREFDQLDVKGNLLTRKETHLGNYHHFRTDEKALT
jgi:quinol monooxygenase YgiN